MSTLTQRQPLSSARHAGRAGSLRQVLAQQMKAVWAALEAAAQRRAAPDLLAQARRWQSDQPDLAAALRALAGR